MALQDALELSFPASSRAAGQTLWARRRVTSIHGGDAHLALTIDDGQPVSVRLERDGELLLARCGACPRDGLCRHVWCALVAADARGAVLDRDPAPPVAIRWASPPEASRGLSLLRSATRDTRPRVAPSEVPPDSRILYLLDDRDGGDALSLRFAVATPLRRREGFSRPRGFDLAIHEVLELPDPLDRQILSLFAAGDGTGRTPREARLPRRGGLVEVLLPLLARSGRLHAGNLGEHDAAFTWDDGEPWELALDVRPDEELYRLEGSLARGAERMPLSEPWLVLEAGFVLARGAVSRFTHAGSYPLVELLRSEHAIAVPRRDGDALVLELARGSPRARLELPPELLWQEVRVTPRPVLQLRRPLGKPDDPLVAELLFDYAGHRLVPGGTLVLDAERRRRIVRQAETEELARASLLAAGARPVVAEGGEPLYRLRPDGLAALVEALLLEDWLVLAEGRPCRTARGFRFQVATAPDWFELRGEVTFDGESAALPELLLAVKRGERLLRLGDGSFGLLPEEWLEKHAGALSCGSAEGDHLRFSRAQIGMLDTVVGEDADVAVDEPFQEARRRLVEFQGVHPCAPPAGFRGTLRPYQQEGLGWMRLLAELGLGGCLADDMGLGKTVQALAHILRRRESGEASAPSLVVVPRSLVFNWKDEARRFTPSLRVLDQTGAARDRDAPFEPYDVVLTTYGTLLRDLPRLSSERFDVVVLDEAQAIKNPASESARAARLLQARQRLALSGTPVQNHLGELASIFEFLSPGLLGGSPLFSGGRLLRDPREETRQLLSRALRPFILRRTKEQVAPELPARLEQTILCPLAGRQQALYDELRDHYRRSLTQRIRADGLQKARFHVLEGLLRLRQAACHPGLVDRRFAREESAKLEALMAQLEEVTEEGHKAIVFSQFTSFLGLVRARLDAQGLPHAYLDGATSERQRQVERFQTDPRCQLFLISLKAGGVGLNLTAADYVFLLDPWWNPAIEAQAIDRAHRIGQTRQVFAYRLVAEGTVEERILELQAQKRALADAIVGEDNSRVSDLAAEDLELLLS